MKASKLNTRNNGAEETKTPNKFDIAKKKKEGNYIAFADKNGITYGMLSQKHYLYKSWIESGEVDNEFAFGMWIALPKIPQSLQGPHVEFPKLGDVVELWATDTHDAIGFFSVEQYPEHITRKSRSTSVIMKRRYL